MIIHRNLTLSLIPIMLRGLLLGLRVKLRGIEILE
jgi:hypothetical protein